MRVVVHPDYASISDFIHRIPTLFATEGEMLYDKRNKIKRFKVNGESLIVKKFKHPHLIQRIVYTFFKKSKAERAYLYAGIFRQHGFETPHEIAFIEMKEQGLFSDSYFISTESCDAPLLPVLNKDDFEHPLADALARLLMELHQKGIMHGDINLNNVLYRQEEDKYRFTLIDTNRSTFIAHPTMKTCMDNLKRLTHNRDLMEYVIRQYAMLQEWPADECVALALQTLSQFEAKVRRKRKFQSLIGIKKNRK